MNAKYLYGFTNNASQIPKHTYVKVLESQLYLY